jgi:hypothetical protein
MLFPFGLQFLFRDFHVAQFGFELLFGEIVKIFTSKAKLFHSLSTARTVQENLHGVC